jgi:hypothetical protein
VLVLDTTYHSAREQLEAIVELLPPPLHQLVKGVDSAVAAIALTVRR